EGSEWVGEGGGRWGVWLVDAGSRNGVRYRGCRLAGAARLEDGTPAGVGASILQARRRPTADADLSPEPATGQLGFNRPPRIVPPAPTPELLVPVPPARPTGSRLPWVSVLVPLLLGGVLYLALHTALY